MMMLYDSGVRSDECPEKVCSARGIEANSRLDELSAWNAGSWALAAAGIGGGLFLVLTNPMRRTTVAVTPSPSGAALQGTF